MKNIVNFLLILSIFNKITDCDCLHTGIDGGGLLEDVMWVVCIVLHQNISDHLLMGFSNYTRMHQLRMPGAPLWEFN